MIKSSSQCVEEPRMTSPVLFLTYFSKLSTSLEEHKFSSLNFQDVYGATLLHWAVLKQHVDTVRYLLDSGADANIFNGGEFEKTIFLTCLSAGEIPLHLADGNLELIEMLLPATTNLNHQNNFGDSPLFNNASSPTAIALLLNAGADANLRNRDGQTYTEFELARQGPKPPTTSTTDAVSTLSPPYAYNVASFSLFKGC